MAYYDTMGGYTGYESAFIPTVPEETEEERRRRLAAQQPVTEKITYNADGTQKVTISGTPEALSAANPRTPTVVAPVAPAPAPQGGMTQQQYNEYIARNESGGRPDIGYHMPGKSSAFGTYGITNAAYQDIQRADPQFANRPITSLNPQEQTQAQDVYTRQNTRYLQNYGVEPTQGNLALAHFLGAKGAADYIKTGTISQAAAAANGGEDRVREIAQQRLALGQAPVSGAAQPAPVAPVATAPPAPPAPAPAPVDQGPAVPGMPSQGGVQIDDLGNKTVTTPTGETFVVGPDNRPLANRGVAVEQMGGFGQDFIKNQSNPQGLLTIADDKSGKYTEFERQLARDQLYENIRYQKLSGQATQMIDQAKASGDGKMLAKILQDRSEGVTAGGIAKAFLYSLIGFQSGAKDVVNKMGIGATYQQQMDANGNPAIIKVSADGLPLEGYDQTGARLSVDQLAMYGGGAGGKFKPDVSGTAYVKTDPQGNVTMRGVRVTETLPGGGTRTYVESGGKRYDINAGWQPEGISTAAARAEATKAVDLRYTGPIAYTKAGADFAGKFNAENGTNIGYQTQTPGAPLVDLNTGQRVVPSANGTITATTRTGGTATGVTGTGGMTPAQITTQTAVGKAAQEQFVSKTIPAIIEEGTNGSSVANIRTQQINTIKDNPSILGIFNGRGTEYDKARNVITKLITGAYGSDNSGDFYKEISNIKLSEPERAALENFGNLNMEINSKTLKANTGGGQISNAEQKINKEANLANIAEQTPLASLQGLYRSQFQGNLNTYKQYYASNQPDLNTDAKFAAAWQKEQARLSRAYTGIMEARAEYLKQYLPPKDASPQQLDAFKDKVFKAFEMFPAPTFDAISGKWNYQTANAERAAARKLIGQ
jgi:hypothetical protein